MNTDLIISSAQELMAEAMNTIQRDWTIIQKELSKIEVAGQNYRLSVLVTPEETKNLFSYQKVSSEKLIAAAKKLIELGEPRTVPIQNFIDLLGNKNTLFIELRET